MEYNARSWNGVVAAKAHAPFLQSYEWGEFQKKMGQEVHRIAFFQDKKLCTGAQIFIHNLFQGFCYLYLPHGPIGEASEASKAYFFEKITAIQKKTHALFLRWEPQEKSESVFVCKQQQEAQSLQPETTLLASLAGTQENLLGAMHPKTRYNIRLAHKRGVVVRSESIISRDTKAAFFQLLFQTAKRDHFFLHPQAYYAALLESFPEKKTPVRLDPFVRLYTAWFEGRLLAGSIVFFFGDTVTYLHGASSSVQRNVMAPFALHWKALCDAQERGYTWYDFWGIASNEDPNHPWAGLTRFKKGFGGTTVTYPQSTDCIFSPFTYKVYRYTRVLHRQIKRWRHFLP